MKTRKDADKQLSKFIADLTTRQSLLKNLYWQDKETLAWRFNLTIINEKIEQVGQQTESKNPFTKPTLFIRGEKSNYITERDFLAIESLFTNVTIKSIKTDELSNQ